MRARGFSLIEILVVVAISGVLLTLALSSFRTMMASTRTRSLAESIMAGLQHARSEAIRRNALMRFQLVSNLAACSTTPATPAPRFWVVSQTDNVDPHGKVAGHCDAAPYQPTDTCIQGGACTDTYWIALKSDGKDIPDVTVEACTAATAVAPGYCGSTLATAVTFDPLGKVVNALKASPDNINPIGEAAILGFLSVRQTSTGGDPGKTWAIRISPNGGIKFCDPAQTGTNTMACT